MYPIDLTTAKMDARPSKQQESSVAQYTNSFIIKLLSERARVCANLSYEFKVIKKIFGSPSNIFRIEMLRIRFVSLGFSLTRKIVHCFINCPVKHMKMARVVEKYITF